MLSFNHLRKEHTMNIRYIPAVLSLFACLHLPAQTKQFASERESVDLTIYNANIALVREERSIDLEKGMNLVVVPDIPATIDGTSLHFASLTDAPAVKVIEQNYQYDLVHQAKLLEKYVGKEVEFIRRDDASKKEYTVKGKLLATGWQTQSIYGIYGENERSFAEGQMIAEINGKIEINPEGRLVLPSLPEGLILKPQLEWLVTSDKSSRHKTEISYLARQITWNCNYVALLDAKDTGLDLTGWVTITNHSGTNFKNTGLKLVAGDINIIKQNEDRQIKSQAVLSAREDRPQFEQKELFEYKLYSLQRKTDIKNNEIKQIELISPKGIGVKKIFVFDGLSGQWHSWYNNYSYRDQKNFGQQSNNKVGIFISFKNDGKSGMGIPLPKGKVRVYKRDDEGKEQFIGEDEIDHTPKNEEVKLFLGNAFDIVGERAQTDFHVVVSGHVIDETFEIKARSHKSEPVELQVYEHPWRWNEWEITKSNTTWEKVDQSTIRFTLKLKQDEEKVVTYTIRYNW
jgi:hypothetical protein